MELDQNKATLIFTLVMVLHLVIFKFEITDSFDTDSKGITFISDFLTGIPDLIMDFIDIIKDYTLDTYKKVNAESSKNIYNPYELIKQFIVIKDYEKPDATFLDDPLGIIQSYFQFIGDNKVIFGILIFLLGGGIVAIGSVVAALSGSLILMIPGLIATFVIFYIILIGCGIIFILLFRDNTSDLIKCAQGLDSAGLVKDLETMSNKEIIRMDFCKYWLNNISPEILFLPSLLSNKSNLKITDVVKNDEGNVIRVILPGNIIYTVNTNDEQNSAPRKFRNINIKTSDNDQLEPGVTLFSLEAIGDNDVRNTLYKEYMDDYNSSMMKYFAFSNIYFFFIHTIISSTLFYIIVLASKSLSGSETNKWTPENFFVFASIVITFILKFLVSIYPSLHVVKILFHVDLIKDPQVGPQALYLLVETIAFLITIASIYVAIIKNEPIKYETTHLFALPMIMLIVLYIGMAIKILFGDLLFCSLERILNSEYSSSDSFNSCEKRIYTERQRKQICDQLPKETENFTNISKNKNMNKLLGYTNIKENFSVDQTTVVNVGKTMGAIGRDLYRCDTPPDKDRSKNSYKKMFTQDFWLDIFDPIYDIFLKLGNKDMYDGDSTANGETIISLIRLTDEYFYFGVIIFMILKMDNPNPEKALIKLPKIMKDSVKYLSFGFGVYYVTTLIALNVIISDKVDDMEDDKINIAGLLSMVWAPYILVIIAMFLSFFINRDTTPKPQVIEV